MIQIRKSEDRGHAQHGWLDAKHSFSFAGYHDPGHMGFGPLRVLNQDHIAAGKGFGTHPHRDMEIVTYVLEGVLEHKDDMGNGSQMRNGEVQLMSAGSGVQHSEFNPSPEQGLHLLQMWIMPTQQGTQPRYAQKTFPSAERRGKLRLVVSPDEAQGSLRIGQDARMFAGLFGPGEAAKHSLGQRGAWLHVASGSLNLNGIELHAGDGAAIQSEAQLSLEGIEESEIVLWDFAMQPTQP